MTVRVVATASGRAGLAGTGYAPEGEVRLEAAEGVLPALQAELRRVLAVADRANNAVLQQQDGRWTVQGDPTEGALVVAARKVGISADTLEERFRRLAEIPFSSERKLMTTVHSGAERAEHLPVFSKGAPDVLLARCSRELVGQETRPLSAARRSELLGTNDELAGRALRTLGIAYRELPAAALFQGAVDERVERDLVFGGLVGMLDPPRDEARLAVARAKGAGIRPLMITGDHPRTAAVIAMDLGIAPDGRAVTGAEIERMDEDALARCVRAVSVYARVNPEHKLRLVRALQREGAVVAMTGDNFASIVAAVEEGRAIFSNIRKFLRYLLSSNLGEVMTMFFGVVLARAIGLHAEGSVVVLPLLATQLLWINLVTDGAPALALGVDPADPETMQRAPRPKDGGVITRTMWFGIVLVGAVMAAGTLFVLDASLPGGLVAGNGGLRHAQTMAFTTLMLFQLFNVFNARSDVTSAFPGLFTNRWLWAAVGASLALHAAVVYTPFLQQAFSTTRLDARDWLFCTLVASSVLWLRELVKAVTRALA